MPAQQRRSNDRGVRQEDTPVVDPERKITSSANIGEDATARAFKSSTARLLYPVQMSVNVNAVKKFDRDSFETPATKTQQAVI